MLNLMGDKLNKLQKEWYAKLKASGFEDAEAPLKKGGFTLVFWSSHYFASKNETTVEAQRAYYYQAGELLHTFPFECDKDRRIWEFHSEGTPLREIAKKERMTLYGIFTYLNKLKKKMMFNL